jgi:hypothetical protein
MTETLAIFRPFEPFALFRPTGDANDPAITEAVEYAGMNGELYAAADGERYGAPGPTT